MTDQSRIHIIGAGIMGLMIARNLLAAGEKVILYDKGLVGAESSWAGGGILSPLHPWRYPESVTRLTLRSQALYPDIASELFQDTGVDPELEMSGMLILSETDHAIVQAWADQFHVSFKVLTEEDIDQIEPRLAPNLARQILEFPDIGHIRNPRLITALRADLLQKGCEFRENTEIANIVVSSGVTQKLVTKAGDITADRSLFVPVPGPGGC